MYTLLVANLSKERCMHVCMHAYMHVCVSTRVYNIYIYIYIYIYMENVHARTHARTHTCIYSSAQWWCSACKKRVGAQTHVHTYENIKQQSTHMYVCLYVCMYVYKRTSACHAAQFNTTQYIFVYKALFLLRVLFWRLHTIRVFLWLQDDIHACIHTHDYKFYVHTYIK